MLHRRKPLPAASQTKKPHPSVCFTHRRPPQRRQNQRCRAAIRTGVMAVSADKNFYQLLDIPKDADTKTIKKAFKKMALKYHPDVNKEPDAKDRFMACKTAYQTLADEAERKRYDRTLEGGGGFDWGSFSSGFTQSSGSQQKRKPKKEEEDFYGFSQFFDDLEKEFQERQAKKTDQPRSLWQELYDVGEEFVDFLEQGVGSNDKAKAAAASQTRTTKEGAEKAKQTAQQDADQVAQEATAKADEAKQSADDEIEEMLAELKRKSSQKS